MLKAILVDDEESGLSSLKEKITAYCPQVAIAALCNSAATGIEAINSLQPDIVFLDIEMPVMNGFVMLQQLQHKDFELVFTTAYDHYAIKAIRFSALDYLVKPIEIDDLKTAVQRAVENRSRPYAHTKIELLLEQWVHQKNSFSRIAIPSSEGLQFLKTADIIYLEASGNYTNIFYSDNKKFLVSRTLKDFEDLLPPETFLRIHNACIINKNFAEKYIRGDGGQLVLSNGRVLDVAKRKKAGVLKALGY